MQLVNDAGFGRSALAPRPFGPLRVGVSLSAGSWLLGLLHYATVLEPPSVRDDVVQWLQTLAAETPARDGS